MTKRPHFDGLNMPTPIESDANDAGHDAPAGRPFGSSRPEITPRVVALERRPPSPERPGARRIRFDALKCNRALGLKYAGQAGITFRRWPESDALKCNRALGLKYEGRTGLRSVRLRSDALISTRVLVKDTTWSRPVRTRPRSRIDVIRWVYDPSRVTVRSEGNEDSTPAVRRIDGI